MTTLHLIKQQASIEAAVDRITHAFYAEEKHDCEPTTYTPDECPVCPRCGHGHCRHIDIQTAAYTWRSPCDVTGCECRTFDTGDLCATCEGDGCVEDDRGVEFTCPGCSGQGVR